VDRLLTVEEVARQLRVSKAAVYRWVAEERLPALRAGHLLRFRQEDVERFLDEPRAVRTES
jgi:excisionase family DNA binding protein